MNDLTNSSLPGEQLGQQQENQVVGAVTPSWFARFSIESVSELRDGVVSNIEKINAQNQPFYDFFANQQSKRMNYLKLLGLSVYLAVAKAFAGVFSVFASVASFGYTAISKMLAFVVSAAQSGLSSSARALSDARVWIVAVVTSSFDAVKSFAWPSIRLPQITFCTPVCVSSWFAGNTNNSASQPDVDDVEPLCGSQEQTSEPQASELNYTA